MKGVCYFCHDDLAATKDVEPEFKNLKVHLFDGRDVNACITCYKINKDCMDVHEENKKKGVIFQQPLTRKGGGIDPKFIKKKSGLNYSPRKCKGTNDATCSVMVPRPKARCDSCWDVFADSVYLKGEKYFTEKSWEWPPQ